MHVIEGRMKGRIVDPYEHLFNLRMSAHSSQIEEEEKRVGNV